MPQMVNDREYETWGEASMEASRIGGHVRCLHYDTRYAYMVFPGKDPREWPEPALKKKGVGK